MLPLLGRNATIGTIVSFVFFNVISGKFCITSALTRLHFLHRSGTSRMYLSIATMMPLHIFVCSFSTLRPFKWINEFKITAMEIGPVKKIPVKKRMSWYWTAAGAPFGGGGAYLIQGCGGGSPRWARNYPQKIAKSHFSSGFAKLSFNWIIFC